MEKDLCLDLDIREGDSSYPFSGAWRFVGSISTSKEGNPGGGTQDYSRYPVDHS